jgi:hypothetical protein
LISYRRCVEIEDESPVGTRPTAAEEQQERLVPAVNLVIQLDAVEGD